MPVATVERDWYVMPSAHSRLGFRRFFSVSSRTRGGPMPTSAKGPRADTRVHSRRACRTAKACA